MPGNYLTQFSELLYDLSTGLILYLFRTAIEGLWIELFHLDNEAIINSEKKRRITIVTIWFTASLLIAIFVPNITIVINYLGALAGAFMFMFPGKQFL